MSNILSNVVYKNSYGASVARTYIEDNIPQADEVTKDAVANAIFKVLISEKPDDIKQKLVLRIAKVIASYVNKAGHTNFEIDNNWSNISEDKKSTFLEAANVSLIVNAEFFLSRDEH
jgi:hypothetical protein